MGLETPNGLISGLDDQWPLHDDFKLQGDDHIRNIKNVLKNIFPGSGGVGFAIAITATEAEINFLTGVTSNVQTQLTSNANAITQETTDRIADVDAEEAARISADSTLSGRVDTLEAGTSPAASGTDPGFMSSASFNKLDGVETSADVTGDHIAIETGTITHGQTITPPAGYTAGQCKFHVAPAETRSTRQSGASGPTGAYRCSVNASGVVTYQYLHYDAVQYTSTWTNETNALNYMVIGQK